MKKPFHIDVAPSGAVLLGDVVSCDGFHRDYKVRVQTHVHTDHMDSFDTSKGLQDIILSDPTRNLLISEFNADLPYRDNLYVLDMGVPHTCHDHEMVLESSGHMLGSVQVAVQLADGRRLGYSGDFQWPLDKAIKVDALVVDSTYGSPERKRDYSQEEATTRFVELVRSQLRYGPLHVKAHRGTLQRALQILTTEVDCPLIGTARLCAEAQVYRDHGYSIAPIILNPSAEARTILQSGKYLRFYGTGDELPVNSAKGATITLSAYMAKRDDPVLEYSERSFSVALSNHADFEGTIDYVRETGAKYVVTDNTRGGHAAELAEHLTRRLGIQAEPSSTNYSREWGT
jgi:putative mRNA 3-end processing factor